MIADLVELRFAGESDLNFIRHSWLRSLHSFGHGQKALTNEFFFKGHSKLVNKCLKRSFVLIAHPNEMENIIVGYIVWEPGADHTLVHYIYTKSDYRNMGLAKYLIETVRGETELIATARGMRFRDYTYNPYLLIEGIDDAESDNEKESDSNSSGDNTSSSIRTSDH